LSNNYFRITKKIVKQYFDNLDHGSISKKVPLAVPPYSWEEVCEALDSMLTMKTTMGEKVRRFEKSFAKYVGTRYAVMVNSGSSANLLALSVLSNPSFGSNRIRKGDEIITPAVTWATTVYPIANVGAKPVFIDVDRKTYNIDADKIEQAITKKTKAIMPVHLLGFPSDMKKIKKIAGKHDLHVIEDSCEAHGAEYFGKKVGSIGDIGTFSFFASHHITTMEGGMLVTSDKKIYELGKAIRAFGWVRDLSNKKQYSKKYPAIDSRFLFVNTGYNLRPTEIQGAFGIHQIRKLNSLIKIRIENAQYWKKRLGVYSQYIMLPPDFEGFKNVYMTYPLTVIENHYFDKDDLVEDLERHGIETRPVMAGNMVRQPVMSHLSYRVSGRLVNSEYIMNNSFLIGNHQAIDVKKREYLADVIIRFLDRKTRSI
jgi:CDP-4-dehydro-6-deoxyglucose reductase, E1